MSHESEYWSVCYFCTILLDVSIVFHMVQHAFWCSKGDHYIR